MRTRDESAMEVFKRCDPKRRGCYPRYAYWSLAMACECRWAVETLARSGCARDSVESFLDGFREVIGEYRERAIAHLGR